MTHIIHFTNSYDNLNSILQSKSLHLHYCKEDFCLGDKKVSRAAHPIISFSEYNVSTIDKKTITYGKFGIAFSKQWIEKHRIHPVLYVEKNSLIAQSLADLLIARRKKALDQLSSNVRLSIMNIKCFTKNSRGYNSYLKIDDFDFKREKEWRYVPTKKQIEGKLISQSRKKYLAKQDYYNKQLEKYPLTFSITDIEYLFVNTQKQVDEICKLSTIDKSRIRISRWKTKI